MLMAVSASGQEGYHIHGIRITGNSAINTDALKERMALHGIGAIKRKIFGKSPAQFSDDLVWSDFQRLVRFYQREGFLYATVEISDTVLNHQDSTISFTVNINEGDSITIGNISFSVSGETTSGIESRDSLLSEFKSSMILKTAGRFRDAEVRADQDSLINAFRNAGYPYVKILPEIKVIHQNLTADINWNLETGPRCVFGDVSVLGNNHATTELIAKRLVFEPGETYSKKLIDETQSRIYGLGLFRVTAVKAVLPAKPTKIVPIEVHVVEAPRYSANFGVGYGREDRFRTFLTGRWLGFLGGARRLEPLIKHSYLEPYRIDLKFTEPQFMAHWMVLTITPTWRRENEPGYDASRHGVLGTIWFRITRHLSSSIGYVLERVKRYDDGGLAPGDEDIVIDDSYNKSHPKLRLNFNNSSPMFNPSHGFMVLSSFIYEGAFDSNGDFNFTKLMVDGRHYRPIPGGILALRLKFGHSLSFDEIGVVPAEERFYAGGPTSVRGWRRHQLGPKDSDGNPIGGKSLLEGSIEFRFTIIGRNVIIGPLVASTFLDFGNVWLQENTYPLNELRYSAGFGLGLLTPIGPVQFSFAKPVDDEEDKWVWHFNIGHAF
jgi:outer membrane protein insertion porin family